MAASQFFVTKALSALSGLTFAAVAAAGTKGSIDTKLAGHGSSEWGTVVADFIEHSQVPATIELLMF